MSSSVLSTEQTRIPQARVHESELRLEPQPVVLQVPNFKVHDSPEMPFTWADGPEREHILDEFILVGESAVGDLEWKLQAGGM